MWKKVSVKMENKLQKRILQIQSRKKKVLYRTITNAVKKQLKEIENLLSEAEGMPEKSESILGKVCVLGAYIKRRGNLQLEINHEVSAKELEYCIRESMIYLKNRGVAASISSWYGGKITLEDARWCYDFFEMVVEQCLDEMNALMVHLEHRQENFSFRIQIGLVEEFAQTGLKKRLSHMKNVSYEIQEEDVLINVVFAEKEIVLEDEKTYKNVKEKEIYEKVRLDSKIRMHNEWGQMLLTTCRYLKDKEADLQQIVEMWRKNLALLFFESDSPKGENSLTDVMRAAEFVGISVKISGTMPNEQEVAQLFVTAAMEMLTNAVRHAEAKKIFMEFEEEKQVYTARFTNDGKIPEKPVSEGCGLGSLRQKTESIGGSMSVEWEKHFALILRIPRER